MPTRNRTIAKNTVILYIRMLFVTIISLYTSRIILKVLGVEDFGIYNIAGSLIAFFSVINTALSSSVQRFLNIELGHDDYESFKQVFNISIEIHIIISLIIIILGETIGLYIFSHYISIPNERYVAAQFVYQFSLFNTCIGVIRAPYNALILSKEKMAFYAYLSILEVFLKLIIVFLLLYATIDKLIFYALLYLLISIITFIIMYVYSKNRLQSPVFQQVSLKNEISRKMFSFSYWSFIGNLANIGFWQGMNIWINIFWGVTLNAAMGITNQVTNTVSSFIVNFQMAYKPVVIQYYTKNDKHHFYTLVCRASKYSFFLLFIICFPLIFNIDYVLKLWLDIVPDYTSIFIQILLISLIINSISNPFYIAIEAHGEIAVYQIVVSFIQLLAIPIGYILLRLGLPPYSIIVIHVIVSFLFCVIQLYILKTKVAFPIELIVSNVFLPIVKVLLPTIVVCLIVSIRPPLANIFLILCICLLVIVILGLSSDERRLIFNIAKMKICKHFLY